MTLKDWIVLSVLVTVYVGLWEANLLHKYRHIRDCPVPLWSVPIMECFRCPHADHCGRISREYREWGCSPETLRELELMLEVRRAELEQDDTDSR